MKLEFSGAPEIIATRQKVWARLTDPDFVAASAPGVESVEKLEPGHFRVASGIGVGTMRLPFRLEVRLLDAVEPDSLRMHAIGTGAGSSVDVLSDLRLEAAGDGRTRLRWSATTDVTGAIANLGPKAVEVAARHLTEQFWSDFARRAGGAP
ncbi:MAG TPA: carbon monoxide dehydrogenase subunit G [Gemmatimonadales bacterium]|nr:carbon monoxide dehydrogenase subunit G [Gemmatimonadales bacterium]